MHTYRKRETESREYKVINQYTYKRGSEGRVGGASHIAPFYFSNFLEFLDEKCQKLKLSFLVSDIFEASFGIF